MGSGKTSYIIQELNDNPHKNYFYATPYIDETLRIKEATNQLFVDPKPIEGAKQNHLHKLLADEVNITTTHSLFKRATAETAELIQKGHYTLILDEVMDVVDVFREPNKKGEDKPFKLGDIKFLLDEKLITIDPKTFYVRWNPDKIYSDYKYEAFSICAQNNCLMYIDNKLMLWQFPKEILAAFDEVIILTYLFNGSFMKGWLDYHNFDYEMKAITHTIQANGTRHYSLVQFVPSKEDRARLRKLIKIEEDTKLNAIGAKKNALCSSWYDNRLPRKLEIKSLKNNLLNFNTNKAKGRSDTKMWTAYRKAEKYLKGKGYTVAHKLEKGIEHTKEEEKRANCFVPLNCRATNIFGDRFNLAYAANIFVHPYIEKFFSYGGIQIDEDAYALSEMLQWIWRSRIRNDQPIHIYIPSKRMRSLLKAWLNHDEIAYIDD